MAPNNPNGGIVENFACAGEARHGVHGNGGFKLFEDKGHDFMNTKDLMDSRNAPWRWRGRWRPEEVLVF